MPYQVRAIKSADQIGSCEVFQINNFQWSGSYRPKSYGSMGFLEEYGFILSMTVIEKNPLRHYTQNDDPVYKDSCLEAFFDFDPMQKGKRYINFEMNANATMLSAFGDKKDRKSLKKISPFQAVCKASVKEDTWSILLKIPMDLICYLYHMEPLKKGSRFTSNFYKISEYPAIEHYASYAPLNSSRPNFHLPEFFEETVIC